MRPAGAEISVARTTQGFQGPLGSALSPSGQKLLSVSSAATRINSADLFDLRRRRRTGTVAYDSRRGIGEAVFYGVTFSPGGKRAWASGGGQNVVHVYDVGKGLRETGQIPTPYFPAGLAYGKTPRGHRIYVANNLAGVAGATNPPGHTVTVIDPNTNHVTGTIDLGLALMPYGVTFGRSGRKAYVTNWMGRSVSVIDTRTERVTRRILLSPPNNPLLADHPNAIVTNPRRHEVYTANGNSDTVSVIDARRDRVIRTMRVGLVRGARTGATPNGLAVSPDGKRLYVALGGENAVAVLDLVHRKRIGFIPTAWNPTDVDITRDGSKLAITTANAAGRRPRRCAGPYAVGDCSTGDLAYSTRGGPAEHEGRHQRGAHADADEAAAHAHPRGAAQQPRADAAGHEARAARGDPPRHLRHQGEPHLRPGARQPRQGRRRPGADAVQRGLRAQPPRAGAPLHAVRQLLRRRRRVGGRPQLDDLGGGERLRRQDLADHLLARRAPAPPRARLRARRLRRAVPDRAARVRPHDLPRGGGADPRLPVGQRVQRGVSFRNYGMYTRIPGDCGGLGNTSAITHLDDRRFGDHVDERYPGFNMDCSDHALREPEWAREFADFEAQYRANPSKDPLPALSILRLPNDHTYGTTPGKAIPESYFADNDLALGRIVERVSKSPFWPNTAILVTEDDAQNGPDHVDAHRTLAYVISPYTQTARVDHTHYDTAGMVATLEDLLGMPPMTIVDQRATRMWKGFSRKPNLRPYEARMPAVIPFGAEGAPINAANAPLAGASSRWNFAVEDATPEIPLNEAIWKSVHGRRSAMPAPRHDYIIGSQPADADALI